MKKQTKIVSICLLFVLLSLTLGLSSASADSYPERPITWIVPCSAGGGSDLMARSMVPYLREELGVDIVVENRGGAGTQIGLTALLRAKPDGYTVGQISQPHASFTIALQDAPYKIEDFAFVNFNHNDPVIANVMDDAPWTDMRDVIEFAKENPGELAMGVTQMSGNHMTALYLTQKFDVDMKIVPYEGGGPGRAALVGGHVDIYWANALSNYAIADQSKALVVGGEKRNILWPDTPTFDELFGDDELSGFADAVGASLRGVAFPAEFKENYPDRWETFVNAFERAFHSAGFQKDCEETGQSPILTWTGPEKAQEIAEMANEIVIQYAPILDEE